MHPFTQLHERRGNRLGLAFHAQVDVATGVDAAPLRIASLDIPVPFAPELEATFRPTKDKVIEQVTAWMN